MTLRDVLSFLCAKTMSAIATLVAFDGAATPVVHNLLAESVSRDGQTVEAIWRENLVSLPVYAQVNAKMRKTKLPSGVYKTTCRTEVPVMESISGQNASGYTAAPKVAYADTLQTDGFFHERGSTVGRRLARKLHLNIMDGVTITGAAGTTGPGPEMFDQLIAPT